MSDRPLSYSEFVPGERSRDIALTYWGFNVRALPDPGFVHRVWPDGCVTLTLACAAGRGVGAYLLGVRQGPYEVPLRAGMRYWGIRFRPEAGAWWIGVPPAQLREQNVLAASVLGPSVMSLTDTVASMEHEAQVTAVFDAWIAEVPARPIDEVGDALLRRPRFPQRRSHSFKTPTFRPASIPSSSRVSTLSKDHGRHHITRSIDRTRRIAAGRGARRSAVLRGAVRRTPRRPARRDAR